jgi:hypothetical protein
VLAKPDHRQLDHANRFLDPNAKFAFHARGFSYQLMGISLHLLMHHGDKPLGFQFEHLQTFFFGAFVKKVYEKEEDEERPDKLSKRNVFWLARGYTLLAKIHSRKNHKMMMVLVLV